MKRITIALSFLSVIGCMLACSSCSLVGQIDSAQIGYHKATGITVGVGIRPTSGKAVADVRP